MLLDATDKFEEETAGGALGMDIGRAQSVCGQAAQVRGALEDDCAPPCFSDRDSRHDAARRAADDDGVVFECCGRCHE